MALVDGGAAIISTLADPTLGVLAKITAAAGIAAQVKTTIDNMKKVEVGSGGGSGIGVSRGIGSRPRASGLIGTTDTGVGNNLNKPAII